jgi:hypothetical protein
MRLSEHQSGQELGGFEREPGEVGQPGAREAAGEHGAGAVVEAAEGRVAARRALLPKFFELPEGDELLVGLAAASAMRDFRERADERRVPARRSWSLSIQ